MVCEVPDGQGKQIVVVTSVKNNFAVAPAGSILLLSPTIPYLTDKQILRSGKQQF